jgi:hypothetical protein
MLCGETDGNLRTASDIGTLNLHMSTITGPKSGLHNYYIDTVSGYI